MDKDIRNLSVLTDISSLHVLVISISAEKWCSFTSLNTPEQIVARNLAHITTLNNIKILLYTFYTTSCVQITLKIAITQQFGKEYRKYTPHTHEWRDLASFPSILIKCRSTTHTCEISLEYTILFGLFVAFYSAIYKHLQLMIIPITFHLPLRTMKLVYMLSHAVPTS